MPRAITTEHWLACNAAFGKGSCTCDAISREIVAGNERLDNTQLENPDRLYFMTYNLPPADGNPPPATAGITNPEDA